MVAQEINIGPQPGPQTQLLECGADIAIFGGAAGGGKSFGMLLDACRHINDPRAGAVFFRRTTKQIKNEGGLWDQSEELFPLLNARPIESRSEWEFPSGFRVKFTHLEFDKNVIDWQGSQIPIIYFDELTHFTEKQFWYILSRNRSMSNVIPYARASTNPKKNSWVRELIDWWIGDDGFPILSRAGKIRYFIRDNNAMVWGDTKEDLLAKYPNKNPRSLTFIPSKLSDNKILLKKNPEYKDNLEALPRKDKEELLDGNWNVEKGAGDYFQKHYFEEVDAHPPLVKTVRAWDRAATEYKQGGGGDPDWTVGLKMGRDKEGFFYILDIVRVRHSAHKVEKLIKNTAIQDGTAVAIKGFQDPGSAGKGEAENFIKMLAGFNVKVEKINVNKEVAAKPVSAQAEAGNIKILSSCSNKSEFYDETTDFPDGGHDDIVDALSLAFNHLALSPSGKYTKEMKETRMKMKKRRMAKTKERW